MIMVSGARAQNWRTEHTWSEPLVHLARAPGDWEGFCFTLY